LWRPPHANTGGVGGGGGHVVVVGGGVKTVGMQRPPQTIVGVQKEPVEHWPAPTMQVCVGGGGCVVGKEVAMQAPTQAVGAGGQTLVGVQIEAVPQGPLFPSVQGISGGVEGEAMQRPWHVSV